MKKVILLAMAAVSIVACQKNGDEPTNATKGSAMNLVTSINNGTKSVVDGTSLPDNARIGVRLVKSSDNTALYPTSGDFTDGSNVPFQYSASSKGWLCNSISDTKKFILSPYNASSPGAGEVDFKATAYAYYPYTTEIGGIGSDATIPVSTKESGVVTVPATIDAGDAAKNVYTTKGKFTDENEIDYMWATNTTPDGGLHAANADADFSMNHGMARVSFVLTKKAAIADDLFFEGFSIKSEVLKGADVATSKMNISTGALAYLTSSQFNREVKNYKVAESPVAAVTTKEQLADYVWVGAVVAPTSGIEATGTKAVSVDVTISKANGTPGSIYTVTLPNTQAAWAAGSHYVYHIEMVNMNSLKVRQVTVVNWADTFGGSSLID